MRHLKAKTRRRKHHIFSNYYTMEKKKTTTATSFYSDRICGRLMIVIQIYILVHFASGHKLIGY